MYKIIFLFALLLVSCTGGNNKLAHLKEVGTENILFIGNSYTYRNCGVDCHLRRLISGEEGLENVRIIRAAKGKYHLYTHYKDPETIDIVNSARWDKVILQEYSSGPIREAKEFFKYAKLWKQKFLKINPDVQLYLYSTWGYKKHEDMGDSLHVQYRKLSEEIEALHVPVGMLWKKIKTDINLYDGDGAHPNRKGTFLNACLFYEYLFNRDVRKTKHKDDRLPEDIQIKLKHLAHEYYKNHKDEIRQAELK